MLKQLMNKEIMSTKNLYIKSNIVKSRWKKKHIYIHTHSDQTKTKMRPIH